MTKVRMVKCSTLHCTEIATWKSGTWWFCKKHIQEMPTTTVDGMCFSPYGTTNECGPCRAEDYWIGDIPLTMTVETEVL